MTHLFKHLLAAFFFVVNVGCCASCDSGRHSVATSAENEGDTSTARIERSFSADFNSISAATGIRLKYVQGSPAKVVVEGRQKDINDIDLSTRDNTLRIKHLSKNLKSKRNVTVIVTAPEVTDFDCSTGVSLEVEALTTRRKVEIDMSTGGVVRTGSIVASSFELDLSTGASASIADIQGTNVELDLSTGASASIAGRCENLSVEASTGASADASRLICHYARVDASTGATVTVNAERTTTDASIGATIRNVRP